MLPVWVTCSPASCKLVGTIRTHFQNLLQRNQILTDHRIIAAFRRNRNLGDFLIKAKVPPLSEPKSRDQGKQFFFHHQKWVQSLSLSLSLIKIRNIDIRWTRQFPLALILHVHFRDCKQIVFYKN